MAGATPGPAACYAVTHTSSANIWTSARLSGDLRPRTTQPQAGSRASTHIRNNPLSKPTNLESGTDAVLLCHHSWCVSFNYQVPRFNLNSDVTSRNSTYASYALMDRTEQQNNVFLLPAIIDSGLHLRVSRRDEGSTPRRMPPGSSSDPLGTCPPGLCLLNTGAPGRESSDCGLTLQCVQKPWDSGTRD